MPDKVKAPFKAVREAIVDQVARTIHELPEHVQATYYLRLRALKLTTERAKEVAKRAFG